MATPHSPAARMVGERVAEHRRRAGLSAKALAECADLDLTHLQRLERGAANPTLMTLAQVAIALEVDLGELVSGIGPEDLQDGRFPHGHSQHKAIRGARGRASHHEAP